MDLFLLHSLAESGGQFSTLDRDQTFIVRCSYSGDIIIPSLELLKVFFDALKVRVSLLPVFEDKVSVELIDLSALFILSHIFLKFIKILTDPGLDCCFGG